MLPSTKSIQRLRALRSLPQALTTEQLDAFDRDGVLLPIRGISEDSAHSYRGKIEAMEKKKNMSGASLFTNGHLLYKWQHDLATESFITSIVRDLIGDSFYIWKCQLWIKEPKNHCFIGWHQDAAYWGLEPPDCVNVWMALTDVTEDHGPMELLKGSHVEELLPHEDLYEANNLLTRGQVIPTLQTAPGPDPNRTVSAILKPGEFSIHHLCTAHGGGPNVAEDRRIGFNVTFAPMHVRSLREGGNYGQLVKGAWEAGSGIIEDPVPESDEPSEALLAAYQAKMDGMSRSIMHDADLKAFADVSQQRTGMNVPGHIDTSDADAGTTSLASSLLRSKSEGSSE